MVGKPKNIKSVRDLIKHLRTDISDNKRPTWFRGHAEVNWNLLSSYSRLINPPSENTLLKKFKQNAAMLIDHRTENSFDWLFLMQHYGVPTRLLDWSESPLAALYFAVDTEKDSDGALWSLDPVKLNKNAGINSKENCYLPSFDDEELINYSPESFKGEETTELLPVATIATRNNPRIQAQLGVFTISHRDKTPIDKIGKKDHIRKYLIPKESKADIQEELTLCGITKFQLFPELSSIGDNIEKELS
ncbi:FRG domain-containing protein [uncultured Desulfuromusa sp.]|uniref:FRG domain-containing protein n=1 Tax=uncultured Desulfuromusa sp. TaxID=219183 RepID=UPI002AA81E6D|nr:FRG domain-containing protein [uncultured Desulfuromusa sp.]